MNFYSYSIQKLTQKLTIKYSNSYLFERIYVYGSCVCRITRFTTMMSIMIEIN